MESVANLFVRFRPLVGWMLLIVTAVAALGYLLPLKNQHPLERYESPLEDEPPTQSEVVQSRFNLAGSDAFMVIESDQLFTPQSISAVRKLVASVEALDFVDSVFWADRVPVLNVFGFADPLIPPDDASPEAFAQAGERLRNHALAGQLISDDGRALLLPIVYDWLRIDDAYQTTEQVLSAARNAINTTQTDLRVRLTGRAPLFIDQHSAFSRNQIVFQVIGYSLALVLASIMFRGLAAVLVVAAAPCLGVFWTLGLVKLFGVPANPLAEIVMPVMVAMVGLTDGVHLLVHIRRRRVAGDEPLEAARSAIEKVGLACWLTSLTTAIGFASLLLARSDYVQDFGRVCCLGVFIAFVAVVSFIPWVASTWVGRYIERGQERDLIGKGVEQLRGLINAMLARRWSVSIVSVLITVALAAFSLRLTPDNRMKSALPASSQSYQALEYCDDHFGGIEFFRVEIAWPEAIASDDPSILGVIREAERLVGDEPLLSRPLSVRTMLSSFPGDADDLATQATFLSLMPRELKNFFYNETRRWAVVTIRMQDRGIAKYAPVFTRLEQGLAEIAAANPGFELRLDGQPVKIAKDLFQIVTDLRASLGAASLVILLVLGVVYRSVRVGLLSVVPNVFPLAATGALLYFTGESLDMSSVCAFVVCLGIAVDDTIHFLSRFRQELAIDGDVHAAIRRAFVGVGAALVMTTVILCCGFGTMLLSDLPGHRTFAAMACSTIAAAVVGDLIALPALLSCFHPSGKRRPPA
ncbi:efflux RND transporter permease subunit [Botrimarina hoheduenensis]|uniref:Bifunctional preprotein translocase subunit SecD/SecF n=1 Tax=Botrimarina hoheduenensis TaxID=2528000 RepID=A0A5C5WBQ7_9BACT|nr:MMPL family transporter [Botrimarina hoheduenensis]TWT47519.1 bifunctional preprotein translocase subunit SecD/SecF [Botrimarina hoheduenensis]